MATHSSAIALAETPHATRREDNSRQENLVASEKTTALEITGLDKMLALAERICGAGEEAAAALFVLMGTLQYSADPAVIANAVKHLAFTRCGEWNALGMVDAYVAMLERELLAT